jgi:hypothetical protein
MAICQQPKEYGTGDFPSHPAAVGKTAGSVFFGRRKHMQNAGLHL